MAIDINAILKISQVVIPDIGKQLSKALDVTALSRIEDTFKKVLGPASQLAQAIASIGKENQQTIEKSRTLGNVLGSIFKGTNVRPAITSIAALQAAIRQLGDAGTSKQVGKLEATITQLSKTVTKQLGNTSAAKSFVKDLVSQFRLDEGIKTLKEGTKQLAGSLDERKKVVDQKVKALEDAFARRSLMEQKDAAEERKTLGTRKKIAAQGVKDLQDQFARESQADQKRLNARTKEAERATKILGSNFARESIEESKRLKERSRAAEKEGQALTKRFTAALAENRPLESGRFSIPLAPARKKAAGISHFTPVDTSAISLSETLAERVAAKAKARNDKENAELEKKRQAQRRIVEAGAIERVRAEERTAAASAQADFQANKEIATTARNRSKAITAATREYIQMTTVIKRATAAAQALGQAESTDVRLLRGIAAERKQFIDTAGRGGAGAGQASSATGLASSDIQLLQSHVKEQTRLNTELARGSIDARKFGEQAGLAAKRFGAFIVGSAGIYAFINALRQGQKEAIVFEAEMTKIEQLLNTTPDVIKPIGDEIRRLALATGVSTNDIAKGIETLAQAGIESVVGLQKAAAQLAKTQLGATFGTIEQTVEGLIAIFGQFKLTIADTSEILDVVNEFAAKFAVESKDIFEAVKRGGAAFAVAGGSFKEFVELFSILREGSRESATALGVFFKTGIAKLLGKDSQDLLKKFGIQAKDVVGQLRELAVLFDSNKLDRIQKIRLSEELVGERQFNRLTTLLQQIEDPDIKTRLTAVSNNITGSLDRAAVKRLDDFGVSLAKVRESLNDVVKSIFDSSAIKGFAQAIAGIASSFANITKAISPILPALLTLATILALPVFKAFTIGFLAKFGISLGNQGFLGFLKLATSNLREMVVQLRAAVVGAATLTAAGGVHHRIPGAGRAGRVGRITAAAGGAAGVLAIGGGILASASSPGSTGEQVGSALTNAGIVASIGLALGGPIGLIVGTLGGILTLVSQIQNLQSDERKERFTSRVEAAEKAGSSGNIFAAVNASLEETPAFGLGLSGFDRVSRFGLFGGPTAAQQFDLNFEKLLDNNPEFKDQRDRALTGVNLIQKQQEAKLAKEIREGTFTGTQRDAANRLRQETRDRVEQEFNRTRTPGSKPISKDELDRLLNDSGANFNGDIVKRVQTLLSQVGHKFRDIGSILNNLINDIVDGINKVNRSTNARLDALNNIITNPSDLVSANAPSNDRALFAGSGFGVINQFQDQTLDWANQLRALLSDPAFRGIGTSISDSDALGDIGQTAEQALRGFAVSEEALKSLSGILEQLAAESGQTVDEILTGLAKNRDGVESFVKSLRGGEEAFEALADAIRQEFGVFNRQRELNRTLADGLRGLNQAAFEANTRVSELSNTLEDRLASQAQFVNRTGGTAAARGNAGRLLNRTGTSFGGTAQFIRELLAAATARNGAVNAAGAANRAISEGREGLNQNRGIFDAADAAQARLADLQQQLAQRLSEFDRRINAASQAADILRQAFDQFEGDLQSAGQAVTQFTVRDLASSFQALNKFIKAGGIGSPISGVSGLRDSEFESLTRLLSSLGNIDLGGGITGANLVADINKELGIQLAAVARSQITGQSVGSASQDIRAELKALKDQQAAAAALEAKLRQEQIALSQAQAQLIPIEQQFYKDQINLLSQIVQKFDTGPIDEIRTTVTKLFRDALLVTFDPIKNPKAAAPTTPPVRSIPVPTSTRPGDQLFIPTFTQPPLPRDPNGPRIPTRPDLPQFPDSRVPIPNFPSNPLIPSRDQIPGAPNPFSPIRGPLPPDTFFSGSQFDLNSTNSLLKQNNDTIDGLRPLFTEIAQKIDDSSNKIVDAIINRSVRGDGSNFTLEVSPIQINVALTAPDILKLAGDQLFRAITNKLVPAIAEALGVVGPEVRNVFESNIPPQL